MIKDEIIKYWIDSSDCDYKTMTHLFMQNDFTWALFIGHLVIEKLAKAHYVKMIDKNIPFSHNIILILEKTGIVLDDNLKNVLSDLNTFNINARYDDYKQAFRKKCTRLYAEKYISDIKDLRKWLKKEIKK